MEPRSDPQPLLRGTAEAVHDHDDRVLRRLLKQLAEQATVEDLYALRRTIPRPPTTARGHS
ncbi:hypothetical protein [Kitasatospora sp. NPDC088346]|uniref:hypothetical protein n=1 Tax=Kitasatospora sp. NPDC088346 TaxID=3364073 RepID=UPI003830C3DD